MIRLIVIIIVVNYVFTSISTTASAILSLPTADKSTNESPYESEITVNKPLFDSDYILDEIHYNVNIRL